MSGMARLWTNRSGVEVKGKVLSPRKEDMAWVRGGKRLGGERRWRSSGEGGRLLWFLLVCWSLMTFCKRLELVRGKERASVERSGGMCGLDGKEYPDELAVELNGTVVLHDGPCGACSNTWDVQIYNETSRTLTSPAAMCGLIFLLGGEKPASLCMERTFRFSQPCKQCWVENLRCTASQCASVCTKHVLVSLLTGQQISRAKDDGSLNDCLACDEDRCGPEFKNCAGATRRRCGIVSDIRRERNEVYKNSIYTHRV